MIDGVPESNDQPLEETRKLEQEADSMNFVFKGKIFLEHYKGDKVILRDKLPDELIYMYCEPALQKMLEDIVKETEKEMDKLEDTVTKEEATEEEFIGVKVEDND